MGLAEDGGRYPFATERHLVSRKSSFQECQDHGTITEPGADKPLSGIFPIGPAAALNEFSRGRPIVIGLAQPGGGHGHNPLALLKGQVRPASRDPAGSLELQVKYRIHYTPVRNCFADQVIEADKQRGMRELCMLRRCPLAPLPTLNHGLPF